MLLRYWYQRQEEKTQNIMFVVKSNWMTDGDVKVVINPNATRKKE
jgi:hypothetical protein